MLLMPDLDNHFDASFYQVLTLNGAMIACRVGHRRNLELADFRSKLEMSLRVKSLLVGVSVVERVIPE